MLLLQQKGSLCQKLYEVKKLAVVLATSLLVTAVSIRDTLWPLERVSCINNPFCFKKDLRKTRALIDLSSDGNAMTPAYKAKLRLEIQKTDIEA